MYKEAQVSFIWSPNKKQKSVKRGDWKQFLSYKPQSDITMFAHDFVRLSFAMCGANIVDILSLQNRSIADGQIHFTRTKTSRVDTNVGIPLSATTVEILQKYGVINANKPNAYILPYYQGMNEQQITLLQCSPYKIGFL